eukprot:UN10735
MMAFDLTTIEPSAFMEFRDNWIKETGLESVGADRLFDNAGLLELVELNQSELKEYAQEIGCSVIEGRRLIKGIMKLNGEASTPSPSASIAAFSNSYSNLSNTSSSNIPTPYRKASKVAGPLVKWVKSQIEYSILLDVVRPMQKQIKILSRKLDKKQRQLSMCTQVVNTLEMKISKSRTEINQMVENMIKLQDIYNFGADDDALCNTMSL